MGHYNKHTAICLQCNTNIDNAVLNYSNQNYGHALCRHCQNWFKNVTSYSTATNESVNLYFALRKLQVPALLEVNDGFKTVDISVPDAKVHIEVDGKHHVHDSKQALQDLKRTFYALKDGYFTLRIPNSLVKNNLDEAASLVCEFLMEHRDKNKSANIAHSDHGFCIRCKDQVEFDPEKPLCYDCYSSWAQYQNYSFKEKVCHSCGEYSYVTMGRPLCYACYDNTF